MRSIKHREWLALATVVVVGACTLNPQPDLPNRDDGNGPGGGMGGSINLGSGGTTSSPGVGLGDAGESDSAGGMPGQTPGDNDGQSGADTGGQGAGGESGGQAGQISAGQGGASTGDAP